MIFTSFHYIVDDIIMKYRRMRQVGHVARKAAMRNSYNNLTAKPERRRALQKPMHGEKENSENDCVICVGENLDSIRFILGIFKLQDFVLFTKGRDIFRSAEHLSGPGNHFIVLSYLK